MTEQWRRCVALSAAALAFPAAVQAASPSYLAPPDTVSVGGTPDSLAMADLDRDGHLDLATANATTDTVTVLLGDGAGGFSRSEFPSGPQPRSVIAADLDGDGAPDLATGDQDRTVSVLRGDGAGGFAAPVRLPVPGIWPRLAAGDADGDGRPDLVATDTDLGRANVLLGAGGGAFSPGAVVDAPPVPSDLALADLDGDGRLDLALTARQSRGLSWWRGDGTGAFADPVSLPGVEECPFAFASVAVADVVGGGAPDLVAATGCGVRVWRGEGRGVFAPGVDHRLEGVPLRTVAADMDGDGRRDLVSVRASPAGVSLLLNRGGGAFALSPVPVVPGEPVAIAVGDLDEDGRLDIATANRGAASVAVMRGVVPAAPPAVIRPAAAALLGSLSVVRRGAGAAFAVVTLSRAAALRIGLSRVVSADARGPVRLRPLGAIALRRPAGRSQIRLTGALDPRPLAPGLYRLAVRATAAGAATWRTTDIRITPAARRTR